MEGTNKPHIVLIFLAQFVYTERCVEVSNIQNREVVVIPSTVSPFSFLFHIEAIYLFRWILSVYLYINSLCSFPFSFFFNIIYQSKWTGNTFVCLAKSIFIAVCPRFLVVLCVCVSALVG